MAVQNVVTKGNLFADHFTFDNTAKKIKVNFAGNLPENIVTDLNIDLAGKRITFNRAGSPQSVSIESLLTDIHVSGGEFSGTTLTLNRAGSTTPIRIDLAQLINGARSGAVTDVKAQLKATTTLDTQLVDAFGDPIGYAHSAATVNSNIVNK